MLIIECILTCQALLDAGLELPATVRLSRQDGLIETAARLFITLGGAEAALIELETGYNEPVRQALWRFARIEENM